MNKGSDMGMFGVQEIDKNDEIKCYQVARYISSNKAIWRLPEFPIYEHFEVAFVVVFCHDISRCIIVPAIFTAGMNNNFCSRRATTTN